MMIEPMMMGTCLRMKKTQLMWKFQSNAIKQKEKRLNAHECLIHPWLTGDHSHKTLEIARNRFFAIREKIRQKYANWNEFVLPLGRLSEFR